MTFPSLPPANLLQPRNWHFQYLAEHLREDERPVWCSLTGTTVYDPDVAAAAMIQTTGLRFVLVDTDGNPVAAGGFTCLRGHAWDGWMVGTDEGWRTHWRSITKSARWAMGRMFMQGATRIAIQTLANRTDACAWYVSALGMSLDGILRKAGAHGEDLALYSRIAGENGT